MIFRISLASFGFFRLDELAYKRLIKSQFNIEYILQDFISVMRSSHSYKYQNSILGAHFFKNYRSNYLLKLTEIVNLVATVDFKLTGKEKKGIEYYKNYSTTKK